MNFGGLAPEFTEYGKSLFIVVPVPYDLTSTYQGGARRGPAAILDASANMELYDEELGKETYLCGIHTFPAVEPIASGPADMNEAVMQEISGIINGGKIPVLLGGDHSVTLGAVRAAAGAYPELSVLHLDAHADLRNSYQGTPFSHACIGRRISELVPLVQAGIRSMSAEEADFLKSSSVVSIPPGEFIYADTKKKITGSLKKDVYITIDLDVFDPSIMPSTGTPEPGGLLWGDVLDIVREVSQTCNVRGFDIVELAPIPGIVAPDFLASKLIYRIMGYLTQTGSGFKEE
ncbi:MAG: agmatinase [Syntrophaceae bacterium]